MNKKQFENMSLYTLASLFVDTYKDYESRVINPIDKKLNSSILDYIINSRHDEKIFFPMVEKMSKIHNNEI